MTIAEQLDSVEAIPECFHAASFVAEFHSPEGELSRGHVLAWIHRDQPLAVHRVGYCNYRISHAGVGWVVMADFITIKQAMESCEHLATSCDWHELTAENAQGSPQHEAVRRERERLGR